MENEVKRLITESLNKRLVGMGDIDTVDPNFVLINKWVTAIMALGYNDSDAERAAQDIYEIQSSFSNVSIENIRALVNLVSCRFPDEISAFTKYAELRDQETEAVVIHAVKQELSYVEEGDFTLC